MAHRSVQLHIIMMTRSIEIVCNTLVGTYYSCVHTCNIDCNITYLNNTLIVIVFIVPFNTVDKTSHSKIVNTVFLAPSRKYRSA